jgi:hypothetical protein
MTFVRFAARDPGGANVVASVAAGLDPRGSFRFDVWAMPRATPVFARLGLPSREFPEDVPSSALRQRWTDPPPNALVTATSHYRGFEPPLWALARAEGCPSLALLDSWVNLDQRFRDGRPDYVGYIDDAQADALRAMGFPDSRLVHTGHPWLSAQVRASVPSPARSPEADPLHVLFVSEPIASDVAAGVNEPFGFDEFDAFAVLYSVCAQRARAGRRIALRVRFHPYEQPDAFLARAAGLPPVPGLSFSAVPGSEPAAQSLLEADLVTGIGSMMLLEAFVVGRPVVSLQPRTVRGDVFIGGQRGITPTIEDPSRAAGTLGPLLDGSTAREELVHRQRAFLDAIRADLGSALLPWLEAQAAKGERS